jgi:nucleoside-diphosphate-sugar epimerase
MSEAILVTGAGGFIGTHLVATLRTTGHCVIAHHRCDGDVTERPPAIADVGHIVHLAGRSFVPESWEAAPRFYATNVLGTINVLELCRRSGAALTFVSSYVYGKPQRLPIDEDHPRQPLNPYSHSKILAEDAIRYYASQFGVRASIVRPFNIYGRGQDERFVVPAIVRQAIDPTIDGITVQDPRPKRDFLHVRDLVSLLVAAMSGPAGAVYNAGSGYSISVADVLDEVAAAVGRRKAVHATGEERREEVLDVFADVSRAKRELGWAPRIEFRDGLRDTIDWMQDRLAQNR